MGKEHLTWNNIVNGIKILKSEKVKGIATLQEWLAETQTPVTVVPFHTYEDVSITSYCYKVKNPCWIVLTDNILGRFYTQYAELTSRFDIDDYLILADESWFK